MSREITWLHVSDLHAGAPNVSGFELVLETLIDDVDKLVREDNLFPNFLFFTGDLAYGNHPKAPSMKKQYEEAQKFIDKLSEVCKVEKENVFLVPGNHDVDRAKILDSQKLLFKGASSEEIRRIVSNDQEWGNIIKRLNEYKKFLVGNNYTHLLSSPDKFTYGVQREIHGIKIAVNGFNSVWSSSSDGEKGHLWLAGDWQVDQVYKNLRGADISVLLMHHPINWFHESEDPIFGHRIESLFTFFLHGHEHDIWVKEDEGHTRIAAGACYASLDKPNGYNLTKLDFDNGQGQVWLRVFDNRTSSWKPESINGKTDSNGIWELKKWKKKEQVLINPARLSNVTTSSVPATEREITVTDYRTHRKVFLANMPVGRDEDCDNIVALLRDNRAILLHGMPGQGKTMLAKYVGVKSEANYTDGVFIVDLQNEKQIGNVSKQIGSALGDADSSNPINLLSSKNALIILDSFEYILRNNPREYIKRFLDNLIDSLTGDSRVIITSQDLFEIAGLVSKKVGVLDKSSAVQLFHLESEFFYCEENIEDLEDFVYGTLGGHALTIKVVARYSNRTAKIDLRSLRKLWEKKFSDIAKQAYTLDDKTLIASFELSYASLSISDKHFFLALSLLPDGIHSEYIRDIWRDKETAAYESFASLEERSLLDSEKQVRKMLGPVFLFAQDKRRSVENVRTNVLFKTLAENTEAIDKFYDFFVKTYAPQAADTNPHVKNQLIREHFHNIHSFLDRRLEPSTEKMTLAAAKDVLLLYWAYHNNLSGSKIPISSAEDAVYYFDKAADVFTINGDFENVMRCRFYMGNILWLRGDVSRARPYFDEVTKSPFSTDTLKYETNRAFAHFEYKMGNIPKSIEIFEQLVEQSYEMKDSKFRIKCWTGLIDAYRKFGDYDKAQECFESATKELTDIPPGDRGNIIRGFAYVRLMQDNLEEAMKLYYEAIDIFHEVSNFGEAHCRRGLGDVYVRQNKFREAEEQFALAEKLYNDARKNPSLGVGLVELGRGRLALAKNDQYSALFYFKKATDLFSPQNLNEPYELAQANELIGDAYKISAEIEKSIGYYQLAEKQYQETGCDIPANYTRQKINKIKAALS